MKPLKLFNLLLNAFGEQGWWPVTEPNAVKPSYKKRAGLTKRQKFEVCIGAILAQNTSWKNVEKAIENLSRNGLLSVKAINSCSQKKLALLIRSSGYFNQKSVRLKRFAAHIYNGSIEKMLSKPVEKLREELLSLHGIGPETADSILLYAAFKPVFVVDAYTKRIAERVFAKKFHSYAELQAFFESGIPKSVACYNEFHALLVELGKNYCSKNPKCSECPINKNCYYYKQ